MERQKPLPSSEVIVSVQDLTIKYGDSVVLNNLSADFNRSEVKVVLGKSGCGKTTLLKAIVGLLKADAGTIRLFGEELGDPDSLRTSQILRKTGVLFQNGALLGSLTVEDNIALPLTMHTTLPSKLIKEMVHYKLSQVDLHHAAALYPEELSGGMKKRAALARALALDPPLLFCDEPSAGLDPVTSAGLDDLLLKLRDGLGITIIVVTHEIFSIEKIADKILFLNKGNILFDGKLSEAQKMDSGPVADFFKRNELTISQQQIEKPDFTLEYTK